MAKIYTFQRDEGILLELAHKKLNNKNYLQALSYTDSILSLSSFNSLNVYELRARIYYKMKQYARSAEEWFKYLSVIKNDKHVTKAFNGLGACFYKMNDLSVAGYYFNRQIAHDKNSIFEYSNVTAEFYSEVISNEKNYYLAYPYDKADFSILLERSEELLRANDYEKVINLLSVIPKNSKFYDKALLNLSIAKYFQGDKDGALSDIINSVEINKSAISIANAVSMFHAVGDVAMVDKYVKMLENAKINTEEELYKVAMVYAEYGNEEKALKYSKKYLKLNAYDTSMLLIYGMINYNLKNFSEAEKSFIKVYQINRSEIALYYIRNINNGNFNKIEYSFDVPTDERLKIVKTIGKLLKGDVKSSEEFESEIYKISRYAFSTAYYQMQSSAITLLGELNTDTAVLTMKNALLSLTVFDRVKSAIIGFLVAGGFDGDLPVVFGNVYKTITLYSAEFQMNSKFVEAYAYAVAKLAPVEKDFLPIKLSAENIFKILSEKNLIEDVVDVRSLGAVMYELSSLNRIKSRREFSNFFGANLREIKKIKEMLKD